MPIAFLRVAALRTYHGDDPADVTDTPLRAPAIVQVEVDAETLALMRREQHVVLTVVASLQSAV